MRKSVWSLLLFAVSTGVMALGLGNIELNSGLNQPFDARILLISPTASELDSITVTLADIEAFERAGIERPFILSSLRFEVIQAESGQDYIHISTREALREPFLNFLLETSWSNGRLFREYTVLLDPPLYDVDTQRPASTNNSTNQDPPTSLDNAGSIVSPAGPEPAPNDIGFSGDEVGPISANDTLWSIANRVRPDTSVSVNQMMLALLRANPDAFIENNINGLKQGQILRVPAQNEITTTAYAAAIDQVNAQNEMWAEVRGTLTANTTTRPVTPSVGPVVEQSTPDPVAEGETELRLLAATDQTDGGGQSGATSSTSSDTSLELMNEQIESMTSENTELRDRLTESETIIEDLKRLIALKDDELALMQQQMGASADAEPGVDETTAGSDVETAVMDTAGSETAGTETETSEQQAESVVQDAEPLTDSTVTTAMNEETGADATAEPELQSEALITEASPVPVSEPETAMLSEASILDQLINFVINNIVLVGAVIGGLILLAIAAAFIRKRKISEYDTESAPATEFPDFESSAAAPAMGAVHSADEPADTGLSTASSAPVSVKAEIPVEVAPPPAQHDMAEEDPLAEVNVFLAYEHFDSAEEFVREAISRQPNNLDFHSKLLEVFYSAGDKPKYEAEAKVLYDLVNGTGPHWDMAMIMWQEMSPNRALFSEPAEGEDILRTDNTSGRGIVDLTADDVASADEDGGLDFDLGMAETPAKQAAYNDDVLDITSGSADVLDVTASESMQPGDNDILDVTAAVGLDPMQADDNNTLDLPATDDNDILDISTSGSDDPLDVTAHSELEADDNEDLLDMSATGGGVGNNLDSHTLDFDIGGISSEAGEQGSLDIAGSDENMIEFQSAGTSSDDGGLDLDFGTGENTDDGSLELSMDSSSHNDDGGIELDFNNDLTSDTESGGLELSLDSDGPRNDGGIELDFSGMEGGTDAEMDIERTLKIPSGNVPSIDLDEDEDEDHTVFVPRSRDTGEQSAEDENATKLDLAKAYVELGENTMARSILEEVMADGNTLQRRQAEELMAQIV